LQLTSSAHCMCARCIFCKRVRKCDQTAAAACQPCCSLRLLALLLTHLAWPLVWWWCCWVGPQAQPVRAADGLLRLNKLRQAQNRTCSAGVKTCHTEAMPTDPIESKRLQEMHAHLGGERCVNTLQTTRRMPNADLQWCSTAQYLHSTPWVKPLLLAFNLPDSWASGVQLTALLPSPCLPVQLAPTKHLCMCATNAVINSTQAAALPGISPPAACAPRPGRRPSPAPAAMPCQTPPQAWPRSPADSYMINR
jgi:hypothetical protein